MTAIHETWEDKVQRGQREWVINAKCRPQNSKYIIYEEKIQSIHGEAIDAALKKTKNNNNSTLSSSKKYISTNTTVSYTV